MSDKGNGKKANMNFFRLMVVLSLVMHMALCVFFVLLDLSVLYTFNIASIIIYIILICVLGRIKHIERWLVLPFLEVLIHALLCNLYLGWGYGFSLYGLMLIPVTYYISFIDTKSKNDVLASTCLGILDLVVIVCSCLKAGEMNKSVVLTDVHMTWIFAINLSLCVIFVMAYSAYFVIEMKKATNILEERNEELDFMVHYDALTNLRNRHNMQDVFDQFENSGKKFCVVLGDLDGFKEKNDSYGHSCGDELLVNLSYLIRQAVRNRGEICRWGGDEILMLLKMDENTGYQLVEDIRQEIKKFVLEYEGKEVRITATFGFVFCDEAASMKERITLADSRLYEGKRNGKNRVVR